LVYRFLLTPKSVYLYICYLQHNTSDTKAANVTRKLLNIPDSLWADLKIHCIRHNVSLQVAVRQAIELYLLKEV
jgi:hypothetical protein